MTSHLTRNPERSAAKSLKGKIALITGASKRIGRALSIALAEEGVNIIAHDHRARETETIKVCGEVEDCGAKSWKIIADLERPEEYEPLLARALQTAGSLDILINNASIFSPGTLMDMGYSDLTHHLHVNAWAPFVLSREFARLVRKGAIINLLDTKIAGYDRDHAAYILSKHILSILTLMCALEFAPAVRVNAVAPGLILPPAGKDESYLDRLAEKMPLRKHGGPGDIVDAAIYLIKSDFVTGQTIYVDGGRHLLEERNGPDPD